METSTRVLLIFDMTANATVVAMYLHIFGVKKELWGEENLFDYVRSARHCASHLEV